MSRLVRRKIMPVLMVVIITVTASVVAYFSWRHIDKIRYLIHKIEYRLKPSKFPNYSERVNFDIYGIDVSHHNDVIDWQLVREKGRINQKPISFVFIKATEGKSFLDKRYKKNILEARKNGFIVGVYHFYRPEVNSFEQFTNFKTNVSLKTGDLAPVLDVEIRGNLPFSRYIEGIKNMLELMENHYGIKPILYTSPSFYASFMQYPELKKYPLWIASYTHGAVRQFNEIQAFHQYSDRGKVAGIKTKVDLNGFKGDKLKLQKYLLK
ncbi:MAG: hypothetical protein JXR34_06515 [Bacteroidales bacterium]|nr:hypothetical protein [Bacteroidales bacterium]